MTAGNVITRDFGHRLDAELDVQDLERLDKGRPAEIVALVLINGEHSTIAEDHPEPDEMVEVFRDGELLKEWTFDEVRERAALTS